VDTKYDSMGVGWCSKDVLGPFGVGWIEKLQIAVGVANRIEKLHTNFLWGGVGNEFKFSI
jgi:hypothetical protein